MSPKFQMSIGGISIRSETDIHSSSLPFLPGANRFSPPLNEVNAAVPARMTPFSPVVIQIIGSTASTAPIVGGVLFHSPIAPSSLKLEGTVPITWLDPSLDNRIANV